MTSPPDIESLLVQWLSGRFPAVEVVTDLDTLFESDTAPAVVQVNSLPARADLPAWGGPSLVYRMDVDVDFYGPDRVSVLDLALQVTEVAPELQGVTGAYGRVAQVLAPAATRRPDFNHRVRRYGAVWTLVTRPA